MYYLPVLLLILGGILPSRSYLSLAIKTERNPGGASNIIHDCLDLNEKDKTAEIWMVPFPENLRSLTIQNCENIILNISIGEGIKQSFQYFTVRNIKNCEIIGSANGTSLPRHTTFTNIERLSVSVPLYGETQFSRGVLQFTNVTITSLKPKNIIVISSSVQKFSIIGCAVMMAEKGAIIFQGSFDSLLEIKNSFFYCIGGNFIAWNVTSTIIESNRFVHAKAGRFLLKIKNFNSKGNVAFDMEDCTFKIVSEDAHIRNSIRNCSGNYSLRGKICVGLVTENMQDLSVNSSKSLDESSNEINLTNYIDNYKRSAGETGKRELSTSVARFNNRFFLLWFFAVFALILTFPIAYFLKKFLCRIIDYSSPLDMKHKPFVNLEGTY